MTQDDLGWLETKLNDLEWSKTAMEIVWMTQYDFRWVKSTSASPFWGPSDLNISIYSGSVTSQRGTTILWCASKWDVTTLQMFYMLFLLSYVCKQNPQTTLSSFNSLKPVIKKRQFNAVFTVFQKGFLHVFVCDFWKLFSVISAAYMKQILKEIVLFFTDNICKKCYEINAE